MTDLDAIYTPEWYAHDFAGLQPEFDIAADAMVDIFAPLTALDVGCGPGMVVQRLRELGVDATGFDGSTHAIAYASPDVRRFLGHIDIRRMNYIGSVDLVVCTEVAEHIEPEHADKLVDLLVRAKRVDGWIVFTAAPPGQDGHHHVNCEPPEYWIGKFEVKGVGYCPAKTDSLREAWGSLQRLSHMTANVMVFA